LSALQLAGLPVLLEANRTERHQHPLAARRRRRGGAWGRIARDADVLVLQRLGGLRLQDEREYESQSAIHRQYCRTRSSSRSKSSGFFRNATSPMSPARFWSSADRTITGTFATFGLRCCSRRNSHPSITGII